MSPIRRSRRSTCHPPQTLRGRLVGLCLIAASTTLLPAVASAEAPRLAASQATSLAREGRFVALLDELQGHDALSALATQNGLLADLQRFQTNEATRQAKQQKAYDEATQHLDEAIAKGDLEEALIEAIEAHGLAEDGQAFLASDRVVDLIDRTIKQAKEAEDKKAWVDALSLYRLLSLLHENNGEYKPDVVRTSKRVRVLQIYAPDVLKAQYQARAERRGDAQDDADAAPIEQEHWTDRLEGVEQRMLLETLAWSARRHVDHGGYAPLVAGSVDALVVLLETEELKDVFPSMREPQAYNSFRKTLTSLQQQLNTPNKTLNVLEAESVIHRVMEKNSRTVDLPKEVLLYEMAVGATDKLDDFSAVIWPHELKQFNRGVSGAFYGVGIMISRRDGRLVVVSPLANTPAQRAGIKAGDIIARVDGRDTSTWPLDKAVREITGPQNTEVVLGMERPGQADFEVAIKRAKIEIESIRGWQHTPSGDWDYWLDRPAGIGYVRLSQFIPQTADDLDAAVAAMQAEQNINGLILDLRFNPGGLLDAAVDICDRFLSKGAIVSTVTVTEDGQFRETDKKRARKLRTYPEFPVVILINQGSASASEIVSGALQDYERALIVGTRSFGKGSVQDLFPLAGRQAMLKLTRQYYMLPHGRIIHRKDGAKEWGIAPDLEVEMTSQQVADAIELRQEIDIIRERGEKIFADEKKPWAADDFRVPDGASKIEGKRADDTDRKLVEVQGLTAQTILDLGLDPQLEAAALVLKTRIVADRLTLAKAE